MILHSIGNLFLKEVSHNSPGAGRQMIVGTSPARLVIKVQKSRLLKGGFSISNVPYSTLRLRRLRRIVV